MQLYLPQFIGSGAFHDTVTVNVCLDSECRTQIPGSPVTIAVIYTVTGNVISDASFAVLPGSFNLEAPSSGSAPTAVVNLTAYDLPPYDTYVRYTSLAGGVVANMSFAQTSPTDPTGFAYGAVTIDLKSPAVLGPGVYNDVITLSICYDTGCTKQATDSPWSIPVTYTVTASAGHEFQQQIVALNLTALAADPTGTNLYGTTQETNTAGAQLVRINPMSGTVTASLAVDGDFDQIVVSADGQYVYLASGVTSQPGSIMPHATRVNATTMTADFSIYPTPQEGQMTIAVSPQNSRTWSLGWRSKIVRAYLSATSSRYLTTMSRDRMPSPRLHTDPMQLVGGLLYLHGATRQRACSTRITPPTLGENRGVRLSRRNSSGARPPGQDSSAPLRTKPARP